MHLSDSEERMPSAKKFRFYPEGSGKPLEDFMPVRGGGQLNHIYSVERFSELRIDSPYPSRLLVSKS